VAALSKERILAEIQRTAENGRALGKNRFAHATGIREADWRGRYWARWTDAVREAGCEPSEYQGRLSDDVILERLVAEVRRFGRMPTTAELRLRRREDPDVPNSGVFERLLGAKTTWARKVADYCGDRAEYADVLQAIAPLLLEAVPTESDRETDAASSDGFVYLLKSGRFYKIGQTRDVGRRRYDLAIQLPEPVAKVHEIATDDPIGIERYWHERFASRHKNGEWFELTRADVAAFKKRRFM
jgi:Meiotically Up-regulated Gene 113 (MUG113) protein